MALAFLDSLGALTRGERRTAGNGLFRAEDNLESPWAHRALQAFYIALHFGNVAEIQAAFEAAYRQLARRIGAFVALPLETLSAQELAVAARRIHEEGEA